MTDAGPGDAHDTMLLDAADQRYHERAWSAAAMLYRAIRDRSPELAIRRGVPLALGHCLIELHRDADPGALARELVGQPPYEARLERAFVMRARAIELCRAGDFACARRLLRFLSAFDLSIGMVYYESFLKGRTGCWETARDGAAEPGFLAARRWSDAEIAAVREHHRGTRMLLIMPLIYPYGPGEQYGRSADAFGFTTRMLDRSALLADATPSEVAARIEQAIATFRPDIVLYNSFFELPLNDAEHAALFEATAHAFAAARRKLGTRVVAVFRDAWSQAPERLLEGLGQSVDLVQHCHPLLLDHPALTDPRIYCYFHPVHVAPPTAAPGSIARAGSVGSINFANAGRTVWWAEGADAGLPLDFHETAFAGDGMLSPEAYANLLCAHQITVNLTRRTSGVKIITGRTLEVLSVGGMLLEEDSLDTRYFLQPGRHYLPFETWTDLSELIPWLLERPDVRQRIARDGQDWVERHFRGDWFWAGMLERLGATRA
ncbi:MAG: glycosyltransferase family 1 protein [Alphaproteobacteria bacterium]|nr:glycosyltransferase family 1 protein [Alphaproteobacteria bacterium]